MYLAELCVGCRRRGSLVTFRRNGSGESPWPACGTVSLFMPVAPPAAPTPMAAAPGFRCWTQEEGEREKGRGEGKGGERDRGEGRERQGWGEVMHILLVVFNHKYFQLC